MQALIKAAFYSLFKTIRGASVESGGSRELSSGFLSDKIREKAVEISIPPTGRLLEVGSGEGIFLESISKLANGLYYGVEPVPAMIEQTKARFCNGAMTPPILCDAVGEALPFKNGTFDRIICVNMLHNQPSVQAVHSILLETARICKTGGSIIFDIRNSFNPIMYLSYRYAYLYDSSCKNLPLNTYSPVDIERKLNSLGFSILKRFPVLSPMAWLAPAIVFQARKEM